jgi:hypothetical protein
VGIFPPAERPGGGEVNLVALGKPDFFVPETDKRQRFKASFLASHVPSSGFAVAATQAHRGSRPGFCALRLMRTASSHEFPVH